jgi:glycosyltransferase involved in cell wall biosynthesis
MASLGASVTMVTLVGSESQVLAGGAVRVQAVDLDLQQRGRVRRLVVEALWNVRAVSIAVRLRPKIVVANDAFTLPAATVLRWILRSTTVFHCHDLVLSAESTGLGLFYARMEPHIARKAALVICPEANRAAMLHSQDRLSRLPAIVRNFASLLEVVPLPARRPDRELRLVYAGGITDSAAFAPLLESVRARPNLRLTFYAWGNPHCLESLRQLSVALGVASRVRFCPRISYDELARALPLHDIGLVFPDEERSIGRFCAPNKLGDYLRSGLAVLATPCPQAADVIRATRSGVATADSTPRGIAHAVDELDRNLDRYRQAARSAFVQRFNFEAETRQIGPELQYLLHGEKKS